MRVEPGRLALGDAQEHAPALRPTQQVPERCYRTGVHVGGPVPTELQHAEVQGLSGPRRLGDLLHGLTLVVFLRHFG